MSGFINFVYICEEYVRHFASDSRDFDCRQIFFLD